MFYVTGDVHGDPNDLIKRTEHLSEDDTLIILGDFGFIWSNDITKNQYILKELRESIKCKVAFVDGNHENHPMIAKMETPAPYYGGTAGILPYDFVHLLRGEVYDFDGQKVLTIGGADSIDRSWRIEGYTWWAEEAITRKETDYAIQNAKDHKDLIVLSHDAPADLLPILSLFSRVNCEDDVESGQSKFNLNKILYSDLDIKKWNFGHWHIDKTFSEGFFECFYTGIKELK